MVKARFGIAAVLASAITVSACGDRQPQLLNLRNSDNTPDEFAILPNKPIELPEDLAALPQPAPGAANRVDANPFDDAVAALGGDPKALRRTGIPKGDQGVFTYASRYGVDSDIRAALAADDLEFRRRNDGRLLERLFNVNVYFNAYRKHSLDPHRELERFRRAGVRTVSAPPEASEG